MTGFLVTILIGLLIAIYFVLRQRAKKLEEQFTELRSELLSSAVPKLRKRITDLERIVVLKEAAPAEEASAAAEPELEPPPAVAPPPAPEPPPPVAIEKQKPKPPPPRPKPAPPAKTGVAPLRPEPASPIFPTVPATPTLVEKLRDSMKGEEWEAIIGGSWLNKVGVLVTIIGLVLILNYSLMNLGPVGKIAVGLVVSLALLAGGVMLERRPRYRIFAHGLIGGGWAGLYFTTFAMHGIDASRIIYSPMLGTVLLLAVAVAMIAHSLKYRSQVVTGLAYFTGFLALAISPAGTFAAVATALLAGSLLYISWWLGWNSVAVAGLVGTYGIYLLHHPASPPGAALFTSQLFLLIYWVLFEIYDLIDVTKRPGDANIARTIFPLNAAGFVGVSLLQWSSANLDNLYIFFGLASGAYLLNTLIRARIRPASSFPDDTDPVRRALFGGYEAAVTVAVILATIGLFLKFSGARLTVALLLEAELLYLAGLFLRQPYLRALAGMVFLLPVTKLIALDIPKYEKAPPIALGMGMQSLLALLIAAVAYINRAFSRYGRTAWMREPERAYGYVGSALVAIVLALEIGIGYLGVCWLAFAIALLVLGTYTGLKEFRIQSYIIGLLALLTLELVNVFTISFVETPSPWLTLGIASLLAYAVTTLMIRISPDRLPDGERVACRYVSSAAAAMFLAALLWHVLQLGYLGLGWLVLAMALMALGLWSRLQEFRIHAYIVGGLALATLCFVNLFPFGSAALPSPWLTLGIAALLTYAATACLLRLAPDQMPEVERTACRNVSSVAGTALAAGLLWHVLPSPLVAMGWAALGLVLIEVGMRRPLAVLCLQGHVVIWMVFGRLFLANFTIVGQTAGISHRMLTVIPLIALYYYLWNRIMAEGRERSLAAFERGLARLYLYVPALLAVVLMRFEFGRVATVTGWAVFALVLLIAGRRWNNRDLLWQSYLLALVCFWRSWVTNFNIPESLGGVSVRIATGVIVIACFYAAQFISPRRPEVEAGGRNPLRQLLSLAEQYARPGFSVLASMLLTVLLFYEVSGSLLTVALGMQGLGLLLIGFPARERAMRLYGLILFMFCVLKLFGYDMRALETPYRILSFMTLGIFLIGVSWLYTRYSEKIKRYL